VKFSAVLLCAFLAVSSVVAAPPDLKLFDQSNLAAWCIVPFDAKKRGPEERAAMLEKLGFKKFVYDYRKEHVPTFDAEMEALKKHHIELLGWWFPGTLNEEARLILDVIKRHGMTKCDLWVTGSGAPTKSREEKEARVQQEAARIKPIAQEAAKLGVRVGLYNHGNWFGEPDNMIAIADALKKEGVTNVGIVYNLHHGHGDLPHFHEVLQRMLPYLICFNLDGMTAGGDAKGEKILPIAQGDLDLMLLKEIAGSGYHGPIGILNHTNEDAEGRLQDNLNGLRWLVQQMGGKDAGPRPVPTTWKPVTENASAGRNNKALIDNPKLVPSLSPAFGKALSGGLVVAGKAEYRKLPITVECRAKLDNANGFNILMACDPKTSSQHWELYTAKGTGMLSVYMPGRGGDFRTKLNVCDGKWHDFVANLDPDKIKIFIDTKLALEAPVHPEKGKPQAGGLAFGRLVEGGIGCAGIIDDARITPGNVSPRKPIEPRQKMDVSLGFWSFDDESILQSSSQAAGPSAPQPAKLNYDRAPLHPELWPHWQDFVNRDRFYDFYAKEAEQFKGQNPAPELLPQYMGLDSGKYGHWGNQDDVLWTDARWNDTDLGSVMCGVVRGGGGGPILKGVCVRLGGKDDVSACFDPMTLRFAKVWTGGFVRFDPHRHGFLGGAIVNGKTAPLKLAEPATEPFVYHGFYRNGNNVIFSYQRNGKEFLTSAKLDDAGHFADVTAPSAEHPMRDQLKGGPAQWPQWISVKGTLGTHKPYAVDTLPLPADNPWKTLFFVSGEDFFSNGDAAIATMTGEIWLCRGIDEGLQNLRWKRYATGLHHPLGLKIVDDKVYVLGRDQITCLHDLNGDDEADFYECVSNAQITSPAGHDFITGLEHDKEGYFYFASGNQGVSRVKPGGAVEVLATGFRNPNGLGISGDGFITGSVQEGDWTPASAICQIPVDGKEHYYGHGGPKPGKVIEPPLVYLPRGEDNSCGGQCFTKSDKWGPLGGQLIHFSSGAATHFLILREKIGDLWQGAAVVLPGDFISGLQQGRIRKQDGQLYVSGLFGWGTYAPADGCFQRVRYTGGPAYLPVSLSTHENGLLIKFSDPLDPYVAEQVTSHFAQCWNYHYAASYGSPELSLRWPSQPGHDPLPIRSAHVLEDGRTLFLEIPLLTPANQVHLHVAPAKNVTQDLFLTVHRMNGPFTQFPGYRPEAKQQIVALQTAASAFAVVPAKPNSWAQGERGREITIEAALGLQFAQKTLEMHPGEKVSLTFKNPDVVPHNWVLLKPGTLQSVGDAANKMITDPQGIARHYVPDSPDVLAYTDMTNPTASFTIHFTAPEKPGDYPYMCTFPGHWVVMNGVVHVK
jgi:azurin